ncbi:hypothetical protein EYF80_001029 [Liparis tanakae]|uniref:Uncharacterized protein n=1 Tax=Liparis tanakae TaxID=230148 RepID=A0A4Z2JFE2_9TELE|nr:hypothetical protein EYF80_001029 [Liparis tanakae]
MAVSAVTDNPRPAPWTSKLPSRAPAAAPTASLVLTPVVPLEEPARAPNTAPSAAPPALRHEGVQPTLDVLLDGSDSQFVSPSEQHDDSSPTPNSKRAQVFLRSQAVRFSEGLIAAYDQQDSTGNGGTQRHTVGHLLSDLPWRVFRTVSAMPAGSLNHSHLLLQNFSPSLSTLWGWKFGMEYFLFENGVSR